MRFHVNIKIIFVVIIFSYLHKGVQAQQAPKIITKVSIQYGSEDGEFDACPTLGHVEGLSQGPDGFLAVKEAPDLKAIRTDKLVNKRKLWICETSKDGNWFGIVYPEKEEDCGVTKGISPRKDYQGPCKSGWVSKKYVVIDAG